MAILRAGMVLGIVSGEAIMGAKGPDKYLPPNVAFRCEYVRSWLKIKKRWKLGIPEPELKAIKKILESCPQGP